MNKTALTALLAAALASPIALADYDAAGEAKEAAKRKAEQQAAAKKKAEHAAMLNAEQTKMMRQMLGAEAQGKSDSEVKVLYDAKMGAYMKQAKEAEKMYGGKK